MPAILLTLDPTALLSTYPVSWD